MILPREFAALEAPAGPCGTLPAGASSAGRQAPPSPALPLFEYGVQHVPTGVVMRSGMTLDEAGRWLTRWDERGKDPGVFTVVRRPVGAWEKP